MAYRKDDKAHVFKKPRAKTMKNKTATSSKVKKFVKKRMEDYEAGKMHSRVKKTGPKVTHPKQALAIAFSEARSKGARIPKKGKK